MKEIADVSFYQDDNATPQGIDFEKMKLQSDAVIIRAGQNTWIDSDFKTNWAAAKAAGLMRGSYWYYDSRSEPEAQARLWAQALDGDFGELPLCLDFEESYGGAHSGWSKWWGFVKNVRKHIPEKSKHLMIYTGYYYWLEHTETMPQSTKNLFAELPLWIARYKATEPLIPSTWDKALLWQYTSTGDGPLWGVESLGIDLNRFLGDATDWSWFTGFTIIDPPPPDPTPDPDPPAPIDGEYSMNGKITIAGGKVTSFIPDEAPEEPKPEPIYMQLKADEGEEFVRFYRTPDDNESHKIQLWYHPSFAILGVLPIPKYRKIYKGNDANNDPIYNLVPNYETEADFLNLSEVWGFAAIQVVRKNNDNYKWLHTDWTSDGARGNWDVNGCYFKLKNVVQIGTEPPPAPDPLPAAPFTPIVYTIPDDGRTYYQLKHDWDSPEWGENGSIRQDTFSLPGKYEVMPETVIMYKETWADVPSKWVQFQRDLAKLDSPDKDADFHENAFSDLIAPHRAFTDLKGHYVDDNNYSWKTSISTGGNIVRGYRNGVSLHIETFDISADPPSAEDVYSEFWRIHRATQIYPRKLLIPSGELIITKMDDGTFPVKHFPQGRNKNNEPTGTTFPLWSVDGEAIVSSRHIARELKPGDTVTIVNLDR